MKLYLALYMTMLFGTVWCAHQEEQFFELPLCTQIHEQYRATQLLESMEKHNAVLSNVLQQQTTNSTELTKHIIDRLDTQEKLIRVFYNDSQRLKAQLMSLEQRLGELSLSNKQEHYSMAQALNTDNEDIALLWQELKDVQSRNNEQGDCNVLPCRAGVTKSQDDIYAIERLREEMASTPERWKLLKDKSE